MEQQMNTGKHKLDELNDENGKQKLIAGIKDDAEKEAEKIIKQAETSVTERKQAMERQVNSILIRARAKADEQAALIQKNTKSGIAVEIKRLNLKIMDRMVSSTIEKVKEKTAAMIGKPEYPGILLGWIVEAAIGLNVNEAYVNASLKEIEYINAELLKKAADTLFSLTGKKVMLMKSEESPLLAQGVVLCAKDGKTAFNNQVPTRLLRYQSVVRKMIYNILYGK
jgi:vacuolar-type H+-ATPase subunit E/Vma4